MSGSDVDKTPKEGKELKEPKTPSSQEQTSSASGAVPADWSGFQTYSPIPPHGFLASSPQAHPYMWGVQQFIPPYGTPPHPYVAMYPHGGIYAHPTMAPGSYPFSPFAIPSPNGIAEASGRTTKPGKTSGATEMVRTLKVLELQVKVLVKEVTKNSQNESQEKSSGRPDSAEPPQSRGASNNSQNGASHAMPNQAMAMVSIPAPAVGAVSGVPGPTTNLNIGMDYWGGAQSCAMPGMRGKDERELKRQRRESSQTGNLLVDPDCASSFELAKCYELYRRDLAKLVARMILGAVGTSNGLATTMLSNIWPVLA
ncbi:hypothetical protein SASPL_151187 [Salvia splendens]|uniref:G-box binding protein multifunctional mosaic region domain-containing protein n=1 Tax=Salvia splendens TaxID=180675 RepID=A0A8X8Z3D3_SALSN|nr:hypothetical protein SASPL_151187 [Salvia splendens]